MMSDLIDRQEAIKALTMFGAEHNAIAVIRGCPSRGKASDGDDLIYRQAAIDAITEYGSGDTIYMSVVELKRRIEHLPSAQPERKKGKWIDDEFVGQYRCSECDYYSVDEFDFCPNCGSYNGGRS